MTTVSAVRDVFQKAIDENLGNLNITAVVKLFDSKMEKSGSLKVGV